MNVRGGRRGCFLIFLRRFDIGVRNIHFVLRHLSRCLAIMTFRPSDIERTFLEDLIGKLGISNSTLLSVVRRRLLVEQKAAAADLWPMFWLLGEVQASEIAAQIGDVISAEGVGRLLGLTKSAVRKAKRENRLLAFKLLGRPGDFFPIFQLEKGKVRPWIGPLLSVIGNGMPAIQFLTVKRRSLDGASYFNLLRDDSQAKIVDAMLEHARGIGDPAAIPLQCVVKSSAMGPSA